MKIAIIFNHLNYMDGIAKSAMNLAKLLNNNNYKITLIPLYEYDKKLRKEIDENIEIINIFGFYFCGLDKIVNLIPFKILYKFFIRDKYDIEIAYQYGTTIKLIANSQNKKAKHIGWMHGYDEKLILKEFYLKLDAMCGVCNETVEKLKKDLEDKIPIYRCYNLVDSSKILKQAQKPIYISKDIINFISVARHSPEKGYMRLLNCVKKLKNNGYKFSLILVGDGPEHILLKNKVKELEIEDIVIFVGKTSNPHKYTSKSDCFLLTSFNEAYNTASVEATILNIPIITTDVVGAKEIINISEVGAMVNSTEDAIYEGMKMVLDNPSLIEKWKQRLEITKKRFYYESIEKGILEIFEQIKQIK